ncbi:MAG: trypsin-like peptidase domain-containing protein [Planctomycetota bacterium]|nr:trypsin-like peptidase domain-containing protein [Planctomycetota bacterium]
MKQTIWVAFFAAVLGASVGIFVAQDRGVRSASARQPAASSDGSPTEIPTLDESKYTVEERINFNVYDSTNRGVVHITTRSARTSAFLLFETPTEGAGSGSVLDREGHILTNNHVVMGAREIYVRLYNGEEYPAGVVGSDDLNDLAVIKIEAPEEFLHPISLGDSARVRVGQKIHAIGNPFGLERTYTVGIVSSLNRQLPTADRRTMKSIVQIDAAINPGNSGGPLLNNQGEMVGVNVAIASKVGESSGVGFAIPVNTAKRVIPQLIDNGRVIRPDIGITRVYKTEEGLLIATVAPEGPADKAGLQGFKLVKTRTQRGPFVYEQTRVDQSQADLIVAVDGQAVGSVDQFMTMIETCQPGDQVVVTVIRDRQRQDVKVILGGE